MIDRLAVVAVGGNSLLRDTAAASVEVEAEALERTVEPIAALAGGGWRLVITHGNGPQVGFNLLRAEAAAGQVPAMTLDLLGAQTQGSVGYLIQQRLGDALRRRGVSRPVATVVTQVVVAADDPAFTKPTKPVGPFYRPFEAEQRQRRGWQMVEDAGRGWRRVVPSPDPKEIVERDVIATLSAAGVVVIAAGGGGIPVVRRNGRLEGCEAVIDKDLASARLALDLGASMLIITTAVGRVMLDFGTAAARPLETITVDQARAHLTAGQFPSGSMGPKILAAVRFLEGGGRETLVTAPEALERALAGRAGTRIVSG